MLIPPLEFLTNLKGFKFAWRDLIKEFLYTAVLRVSTLFGEYLTLIVTIHIYIELLRFGYDVAISPYDALNFTIFIGSILTLYFLHISSSASCYCKPVFIILHALVMPRHVHLYFISYLIPRNHLCNRFIASCYGPLLILRTHDPRSYPYRGNININNNELIVYTPLIINNDSIYQSIVEPGIELL